MQRRIQRATTGYIEGKFREYYSRKAAEIVGPGKLRCREFGFLLFKDKTMFRHKCYDTIEDLREAVKTIVPADAYYSAAYYSRPDAEMEKKGWLGSDLIFDIDADHITSTCKKEHDKWRCDKCGSAGDGKAPEKCPICGNYPVKEDVWICETCLDKAKMETSKVLDMLIEDFGIPEKEIIVNFSGNRGYHVHVTNEKVLTLNGESRKEIVDYMIGLGLDPFLLGIPRGIEGIYTLLNEKGGVGWRKRLSSGLEKLVNECSIQDLVNVGVPKRIIDKLGKLKEVSEEIDKIRFLREFRKKDWESFIEAAKKIESAVIDTVVTSDIHRLIRLPSTLNSKTGLKVLAVKDLSSFDPLKEAVAFNGGCEEVYVREAPKFKLGGMEYGPYREKKVSLPEGVSMFLICRGRAFPQGG